MSTLPTSAPNYLNKTDTDEGLIKSEFKTLQSLSLHESYFAFNGVLYKQADGVIMSLPLGQTLANTIYCLYKKKWQNQCRDELDQFVDDIFLIDDT